MRRSHIHILIHFAWATKDRASLLLPAHEGAVHAALRAEACRQDCVPIAVGGTDDHVHLLLSMPATLCAADAARELKSVSSKAAKQAGIPRFAWQENYGAVSVSPQQRTVVQRYIEQQRERHQTGKLMPGAERFWEEVDELVERARAVPPSRAAVEG